MPLNHMDLNLLVALDLLITEQSVTLAAEKAGITQPAMSNTLRRLREHFDDPILVKSSFGKMVPTPHAHEIAQLVKSTLHQAEKVFFFKHEFDPINESRQFKILTNDYMEYIIFPKLLKHLEVKAPNIIFKILPFSTPTSEKSYRYSYSLEQLERGIVDLALGYFDAVPNGIHSQKLFEDQLVCIARKNHPALKNGLDLDLFVQLKHLLITTSGLGTSIIDLELGKRKLKRRISYYTHNFILVPKLIGNSDLISCIPQRIAKSFLQTEQLKIYPLSFLPKITYPLNQVWSNIIHTDPVIQWLREEIASLFQNR